MTEIFKPITTEEEELIKKEKKREYMREYMKKRRENDQDFKDRTNEIMCNYRKNLDVVKKEKYALKSKDISKEYYQKTKDMKEELRVLKSCMV